MFNDEILDYISLFERSSIARLFSLDSLLAARIQTGPRDAASSAGQRLGLRFEYYPNELKLRRLMDFISSSLVFGFIHFLKFGLLRLSD